MNLELRDASGKLNPLILVAVGGTVLLGLYSLSKGGSGSSSSDGSSAGGVQGAGLSSGITDSLANANEAVISLAGRLQSTGTGAASTPVTTSTPSATTPSGSVWISDPIQATQNPVGPSSAPLDGINPGGGVNLPTWEPPSQDGSWITGLLTQVGLPFRSNPTNTYSQRIQAISAYAAGIVSTGGGGDSTTGNLSSHILSPNDTANLFGYNTTRGLPDALQNTASPGFWTTLFHPGGNTDAATIQAPVGGIQGLVAQLTGSAPSVSIQSPVTGPTIAPNFNSAASLAAVANNPTYQQAAATNPAFAAAFTAGLR